MKCSLERYLRSKNYSASLNDRVTVFHKLNQAIGAKEVDLKGQGKGRKELKSEEISAEEEETMWQAGVLGINNPQSANFTMFFLFGKHFGMRGRNEHRQLKFGEIVTGRDTEGTEYLEFHERCTKTRDGTTTTAREFAPKMFATPGNPKRDPVALYREYVKH
ncbi:uncharacterized protein [Ptychodera flava]|uniref:uncharacterized protein n=1 Tax=Ptychodera flava TaxID=63121 RepID=UPI00396A09EA